MTHPSPLLSLHQQAEAHLLPYGPPDAEAGIALVEFFNHLELEYAALKTSAALLDQPHRATIRAKGPDALPFLNNMLTQELKTLEPGSSTNSFWLNRKGRIDADLRVLRTAEDEFLLDVDVFAAQRTIDTLNAFIIMEDVELTDLTNDTHRLALHGPRAAEALTHLGAQVPEPNAHTGTQISTIPLRIDRHDTAGVPGYELHVQADQAINLWQALSTLAPTANTGEQDAGFADKPAVTLRPAGFHAWNMARIEAMTPVFNLDFATDSLPAETSLLDSRVDFKKGCYLGQEVVARMHSLGHPKRLIVPIQFETVPADPNHPEVGPIQPVTGSILTTPDQPADESTVQPDPANMGSAVGGISSSTISPAKGSAPIALATVKWGHHEPGTKLLAEASGTHIQGTILPFNTTD